MQGAYVIRETASRNDRLLYFLSTSNQNAYCGYEAFTILHSPIG